MSFFNQFSTQNKVAVNISSKSIIEILEYDALENKVVKYANKKLNYNVSSRNLEDISELKSVLKSLFADADIKSSTPVTLTMPSVFMGHQTIPTILEDDAINMALTSEAEKNYIFKKHEPVISWQDISINEQNETKFITYSAIQKDVVDDIEQIFQEIGSRLVSIDCSYSSLIRGVIASGNVTEKVLNGENWNILLVTQNSYVILHLFGSKLMDIFEDPIAIKSFGADEIYPAISSASMSNLMNFPSEHLIIVSESDDVSAEILSTYMTMPCSFKFIEDNKFSALQIVDCDPSISPSSVVDITATALGACGWGNPDIPLNFNLKSDAGTSNELGVDVTIMGHEICLTPPLFKNILLGVIVVSAIFMGLVYLIVFSISNNLTKIYGDLEVQSTMLKKGIDEQNSFVAGPSMNKAAKQQYETNKAIVKSYNSITADIPEKLWVEEFAIDGELNAYIKGKSYNVEDIISFFQSLNRLGKYKDLKITSLKVTGTSAQLIDSDEEEVQITSKDNSDLPSLPELPVLFDEKYYEFTFGNPIAPFSNEDEDEQEKQG